MSNYPAYSEYKPTHLGWLHEIPAHWEVKRLKYLGEAIIGLTYSPDDVVDNSDEGTLVLRSSNVQNKQLAFEDNVYVNKKIPEKLKTQLGDILICARNGSRALIGKNAQIDKQGLGMTFGAFMSVFRSPYNDYLSKVFNSALFEYQSGSFLTATINQLTTANLNSFEIPLPPKDERLQIANFLDHETAKIDTLIDKQLQLIKLLKEKRQAVISHAVTKGLNPDVQMKDSGVEWLGEVPEHWVSTPLKHYAKVVDCKHITAEFTDDGFPLASISEVKGQSVDLSCAKYTSKKFYDALIEGGRKPIAGDIIYSRNATVGEAALVLPDMPDFAMGQDVCLIRLQENLNSEYLLYCLNSGVIENQLSLAMVGSTFKRINVDNIRNFLLALPPLSEQEQINKSLSNLTSKYDSLIAMASVKIKLMQERRIALISAAVTGKIDVRDFKGGSNDS
ncbi:restriction endonuclease subunit S [Vibrio splendidus]|uniref:restriction endonuclease subunit S n=1 Tax=Vibrio splendidus TaxID=29497 RepID=UPI00352DE0E2